MTAIPRFLSTAIIGSTQLIQNIFSGTSPQEIIRALVNSSYNVSLHDKLLDWLDGVGYWRGNIRTLDSTSGREILSYWHRDKISDEVIKDRLALPFIDLSTKSLRKIEQRTEVEKLWHKTKSIKETTSYRCIRWLKDYEFKRTNLDNRPMCIVHPGEIALSILLTKPVMIVPSNYHDESLQSQSIMPINQFGQIVSMIRQWLNVKVQDHNSIYCPDSFRDEFFKIVASPELIDSTLNKINKDATILEGALQFNDLVPIDIKKRAKRFLRIRMDEWQIAGTRSIMIWPLFRIESSELTEGLESYALVVPQPDIVISKQRARAICMIVDTLFQQTISGELLQVEGLKIKYQHAYSLYHGIMHGFRGMGNFLLLYLDPSLNKKNRNETDEYKVVKAEIKSFEQSIESHWKIYNKETFEESFNEIYEKAKGILCWPDIEIKLQCEKETLDYKIDNAVMFILLELVRNAYKYTRRPEGTPARIDISVIASPDSQRIKKIFISNPGKIRNSVEVDTRKGKFPTGTPLKGRLLVTDVILDHFKGNWSLKQKGNNVVAEIEFPNE